MDFSSNSFCASGMHLPNGTFATFGGNGNAPWPCARRASVSRRFTAAVGIGATTSSDFNATYDDYDGRKAIRLLQPCTGDSSAFAAQCQWFDNATQLSMVKRRWYSTAEPRADGTVAIIGGFVSGGYINRNWPNVDPDEGDVSKGWNGAENTYEFYPSPDGQAPTMPFMRNTSGLNSYPHTFLMPSGKMYMQANFSTSTCMYRTLGVSTNVARSLVGPDFWRGGVPPGHARACRPRVPSLGRGRDAAADAGQQLQPDHPPLWRAVIRVHG
jgi:hypothetical protein